MHGKQLCIAVYTDLSLGYGKLIAWETKYTVSQKNRTHYVLK